MTFKELIDKHACPSGREFCRARAYNFARIMEEAHDYEDGRHGALQGLRVCLFYADLITNTEGRYDEARDRWREMTWDEAVMLHQLLLLSCGVEM